MTNEEVIKRLEKMRSFHEKNEKNLEVLDIAIRTVVDFTKEVTE